MGIFNAHSLWNKTKTDPPYHGYNFPYYTQMYSADNAFSNTDLSLRFNLLEEQKSAINWSFMIHANIPEDFDDMLGGIRTMVSKSFNSHGLSANVEWYFKDDIDHVFGYTLAYSYAFNEAIGVYIENYGKRIMRPGRWAYELINFDGGAYIFLNKDLQLDLQMGYEQYKDMVHLYDVYGNDNMAFEVETVESRIYVGMGLSTRLKYK